MSRLHDESGASVVELGVAMFITAVMSIALVSWMTSAGNAAALHEADDIVVQDLRMAKELLSRELRVAEDVIAAQDHLVTVWVDDDDDDFMDTGEQVTWYLGSDGTLWRWTDSSGEQVQASSLLYNYSSFGYDSPELTEITKISFSFVAEVAREHEENETGVRTLGVEIHLRNRS